MAVPKMLRQVIFSDLTRVFNRKLHISAQASYKPPIFDDVVY